jgi:hypothetical protein
MKDIGVAKFILGMDIKRDPTVRKLWLNQRKYIEMVLKCFNILDISYVVGLLSRYMSIYGKEN